MKIRTYNEVTGGDRSGILAQVVAQRDRVAERVSSIRHIVAVMSGKGGVGKSLVTAGLARVLARKPWQVGVLDADLHGPTAARMLGALPGSLEVREDGVVPATGTDGIRIMSSDLLLDESAPLRWKEPGPDGFVWRGTLETGMLREFIADVEWGPLDVLLLDLPPGTERLEALATLVPTLAGVVVVTIPTDESYRSVRRSVEVARTAGVPILGIVENMSAYQCSHCHQKGPLFAGDAAQRLAEDAGAPILDRVPFDPRLQLTEGSGILEGGRDALATAAAALVARLEAR